MVGLAQGVLRAAGQHVGDMPVQLYGGHELERDWAQGPLPTASPPPGRKRTMCAPRAGPPTEADKDLRADAEQEKTE